MNRPFNLEEAKAGKPIVKSDGHEAFFVAYVPEAHAGCQVVIQMCGSIYVVDVYGRSNSAGVFFMKTEKKTVFINIWEDSFFNWSCTTDGHLTKQGAINVAERFKGRKFIAIAVPIEIEV